MLTHEQRKRAAKEARKLAMECVNGTAPEMSLNDYRSCACGQVARRAGIRNADGEADGGALELAAFGALSAASWREAVQVQFESDVEHEALVSHGLILFGPDGAVFPLLALADALEADHG